MKNKIRHQIIIFFLIFVLICYVFKGSGYTNQYYALVSISTFIFGIYLAFSIYNNQTKLSKIKELLRSDDANLLSLYKLSKNFSDDHKEKVRNLIDDYLVVGIDYRLRDYNMTAEAFFRLYDYIIDFNPKTEKQSVTYHEMLTVLDVVSTNRTLVTTLVGQKITFLEWFSIYTLLALIDIFILIFNTGSLISVILSALLGTIGFTLVLVLKQLDNLRWQEDQWIWTQLNDLFTNLDLLPYYPEDVLADRRAIVATGRHIRISHYPNPYPDVTVKEVKTVITH